MANQATIFTKNTSAGDDKILVLENGQGIIAKTNIVNWDEIRLGLFFSWTSQEQTDGPGSISGNLTPAINADDPGTLWSFGLKDDNRSAVVDDALDSGMFLGIHSNPAVVSNFRQRTTVTSGGDSRQAFAFQSAPSSYGLTYLAKNGIVNNYELSTFQDDGSLAQPNSFGTPGQDEVATSNQFANFFGLRMRKISGDKIRIWLGRTSGNDSEGNVSMARVDFYLDNFMDEVFDSDSDIIEVDDPFAESGVYPDSFYFYPSNVMAYRCRVGSFKAKKFSIA